MYVTLFLSIQIPESLNLTAHVPHISLLIDLGPTVEHSPAELGGGGQREAGVVELVAVVADADLELDGVVDVLEERGRVKRHEEGELPLPEKLLLDGEERVGKA